MPDRLYFFPGSPFARMCRVLVREWKLDIAHVQLEFPPDPSLFKANPLGQVPVLVADDGRAWFPTLIILEELLARAANGKSIDAPDRQMLLTVLQAGDALAAAKYQDWSGLGPVHENRVGYDPAQRNLDRLASVLDWLEDLDIAPGVTLLNVALACILLWADARGGPSWRQRSRLASIVDELACRDSFRATEPPPF